MVESLGKSVGSNPPGVEVVVSVAFATSLVVDGSGNSVGSRPPSSELEVAVVSVPLAVTSAVVVESLGNSVGKRPPESDSLVVLVLVPVILAVAVALEVVLSSGGSSVGRSPGDSVVCEVADAVVAAFVSVALAVTDELESLVIGLIRLERIFPRPPPPELVVS